MLPDTLIVICGPTASGKTKLAVRLAAFFNSEIISADSRQFFRELNIGTAKPSVQELKLVKHHFIGHVSVLDDYNAGKFEAEAIPLLETLFRKNSIQVMAGGSGLYIDAVCRGFDDLPDVDEKIRTELNVLFKEKGLIALRELLQKHDPEHYSNVDLNNPHRLIRALEVCIGTGLPYSSFRNNKPEKRKFSVIKIGTDVARNVLYEKINLRVDEMMKAGLLDEVRSLSNLQHLNALQTVGYSELFSFLEGKTDLAGAVEKIKQNTRNFAKRQMTWFRKDKDITWFAPENTEAVIAYLQNKMKNAQVNG